DQTGLYFEGALTDVVSVAAGQYVTRTYDVTVGDGQLTFRLRNMAGTQATALVNGLELERRFDISSPFKPLAGQVAAYGFNEGTGNSVFDVSGSGLTGTISGATWTSAGRFGRALAFNGTSSMVTVPDA